jgi:HAD superfamily hydrolase (TIGR01549 family)
MIKAILFDLDDTLILTRETKFEALKFAGKHFYNLTITNDILEKYWGGAFNDVIKSIFGPVDSLENIISNYKSIRNLFPSIAYPDAVETITKLLNDSYKIGIISSTTKSFVISDLNKLGFPIERISVIQGAEDTMFHKPDPKVFDPSLLVLKNFDIYANNCLFVGDLITDYVAARDAGMSFLGVLRWKTKKEEFENAGAKTIQSLSDIIGIINLDIEQR